MKGRTQNWRQLYDNTIRIWLQGQLDNGRGSARLNMFRHLHEVQTGRTSSISHEILGFDSQVSWTIVVIKTQHSFALLMDMLSFQGKPVDFVSCGTADEIAENATKLITFIDLAGHQVTFPTTFLRHRTANSLICLSNSYFFSIFRNICGRPYQAWLVMTHIMPCWSWARVEELFRWLKSTWV